MTAGSTPLLQNIFSVVPLRPPWPIVNPLPPSLLASLLRFLSPSAISLFPPLLYTQSRNKPPFSLSVTSPHLSSPPSRPKFPLLGFLLPATPPLPAPRFVLRTDTKQRFLRNIKSATETQQSFIRHVVLRQPLTCQVAMVRSTHFALLFNIFTAHADNW